MSQSRSRVIAYELIPSASRSYSYSHPLPLIEKQVTAQPVLSGHSTEWQRDRFIQVDRYAGSTE